MAFFGLDLFIGGVITAIPVVTGVAEGVSYQKKMNAEAADETKMVKCYLDAFCETTSDQANEVNGFTVVLKHDKVDDFIQQQSWVASDFSTRSGSFPKTMPPDDRSR